MIITIAGMAYVWTTVPPEYEGSGDILVVEKEDIDGSDADSSRVSPPVLAQLVQDGDIREQVVARGGSADYDVAATEPNILLVAARDQEAPTAVETTNLILEHLNQQLEAAQDDTATFYLEVLSRPTTAAPIADADLFTARGAARILTVGHGRPFPYDDEATREILTSQLDSPQLRESLVEEGALDTYSVGTGRRSPLLEVSVRGLDSRQVAQTVDSVMRSADDELRRLEEITGADPRTGFELRTVGEPTVVVATKGALRSVLAIGAVGFVLSLGLAALVEGLVAALDTRRKTGREDKGEIDFHFADPLSAPEREQSQTMSLS